MISKLRRGTMHRLLCGSLVVCPFLLQAQNNLVPNPSFEVLDTCPYRIGFLLGDRPSDWFSWNSTPEYFHTCAQALNGMDTVVGVPINGWGYQPAWHGQAYVGMHSYATGVTFREYVGAELLCPMVIGRTYHISLRVNMVNGGSTWSAGGACNNIGALFTMESNAWTSTSDIPIGPPFSIRNYAHVYSEEIISDTVNWILVEGDFVADSAYRHIVLGNFFDNAHTDTIPSEIGFVLAYFLIDSVAVMDEEEDCLPTAHQAIPSGIPWVQYDQGSSSLLLGDPSKGLLDYQILNGAGSVIRSGKVVAGTRLSVANLATGVFILNAEQEGKASVLKFVVLE